MLTCLLTMPRRFLCSLHDKPESRGNVFTICSFQAYFGDSYNSLHLYRSYTSPSHSYLRIQTPVTPLEVRLRSDGTSECGFCFTSLRTTQTKYHSIRKISQIILNPSLLPCQVGSPVQLHVESNFPLTELHHIVSTVITRQDFVVLNFFNGATVCANRV